MDWGRAKSVLIIAFLLLNVLLGYQLWSDIQERLNANIDLTELKPETLAAMQQKNIELTEGIPTETPQLRDLTYLLLPPQEKLQVKLETPVDSKVIFSRDELDKALGSVIQDLDQYAFDPSANRSNGVFVLYRMVDSRPLFDVSLELYYNSNQKIVAYSQDQIELVPSEQAKKQTVLPASKAVSSLIESYLPEGSVVKEIRLGYHGQPFDSETQVAAPSWRVMLEDGKVFYVQAISGDVVTDDETQNESNNPT
ncbi:two-component system regulatory protein YycI [Paenibacillus beijingensis]|uniref:Regulatory protein YycH-like domain-containing protein n=1 Tax=Paenibacillus beijingensis TaxID=1126833 RepID=A0A0D5NIP9_9BACL|nr:two-component system regulatory protein YycI [Paenibacillus beijingensis]AJY74862.1 hypothetical protein VN24_09995 [Paenibacillus beijingensis]